MFHFECRSWRRNNTWHGRRNAGHWSAHRTSQRPPIPCQRHRGERQRVKDMFLERDILNIWSRGEKITAAQSNTLPSSLTKAIGNNWAVHMGRFIFFMKTSDLNKSQSQPNVEPLGCQLTWMYRGCEEHLVGATHLRGGAMQIGTRELFLVPIGTHLHFLLNPNSSLVFF